MMPSNIRSAEPLGGSDPIIGWLTAWLIEKAIMSYIVPFATETTSKIVEQIENFLGVGVSFWHVPSYVVSVRKSELHRFKIEAERVLSADVAVPSMPVIISDTVDVRVTLKKGHIVKKKHERCALLESLLHRCGAQRMNNVSSFVPQKRI